MIKSKEQLFDAISEDGLPMSLLKIWTEEVPNRLRSTLQNPSQFFEAFLAHPDGFPFPDELVILWQTNGESFVGYVRSTSQFVRNYLEDGPEEVDVLGDSYQQMLGEIVGKLIMRGLTAEELQSCVDFLGFQYLPQLQEFVNSNSKWENSTASFVASLEGS